MIKKLQVAAFIVLLSVPLANAQNVLLDKAGIAHFYSDAPIEDIEATNNKAVGAMDMKKGTIAVSMLMKHFHFDKSLMEEHFNENYLESEKYPKATFKGRIVDFSVLDFSKAGTINAMAVGEIEIHGVKKPVEVDVIFRVNDDVINARTDFKIALEDHDIKIPKLVIKNIAEVVDVDVTFNFIRK